MKKLMQIIIMIILVLSCSKEKEINVEPASIQDVFTGEAIDITYSSATLSALLIGEFEKSKDLVDYGFYIGTNKYQMQKRSARISDNSYTIDDSFDLTLTGLSSSTQYYYYAYVLCYDNTEIKGEMLSFTTLKRPQITSCIYYASKTVDKKLWLNLTATVDPAGLKIIDAGFLISGYLSENSTVHEGGIYPCELKNNTVIFDNTAESYFPGGSNPTTYVKPYFIFEDGTEVYGTREYMYDGRKIEKEY